MSSRNSVARALQIQYKVIIWVIEFPNLGALSSPPPAAGYIFDVTTAKGFFRFSIEAGCGQEFPKGRHLMGSKRAPSSWLEWWKKCHTEKVSSSALLDLARLGGGHSWMGRSVGTNIVLWVFLPHGDDGDFSFSEGVFFLFSLWKVHKNARTRWCTRMQKDDAVLIPMP